MTDGQGAMDRVQRAIGHVFEDPDLLQLALTHRSFASEQSFDHSYERLEFLGDAVLQLAVTTYLYAEHPELAEGEMAKVRAAVVNERALAALAREFGLGEAVLLGRGEEMTGGRDKSSILSDIVESVLGAIFLEVGFEPVRELVISHWAALIEDRATSPGRRDYKTRLQEELARLGLRPRYEVVDTGPEHAKQFTAEVFADDRLLGTGAGSSKKRAEQAAARHASQTLAAEADA